jgi:predicted ester cyclase
MNKLNQNLQISFALIIIALFSLGCSDQNQKIEDKNKAIISSMIEEAINNQKIELFDELLSPDYIRHSQSMPPGLEEMKGIDTYKGFIKDHFKAFPNYKEEIVQMIAETNKVFIITKGTAKNTGPIGDMLPTNKELTIMNFGLFELKNGKIVKMWVSWDNLAMQRQLGLSPN